ncbi:hypothetical protein RvY_11363 [Ramazzottius varieornatus]|uniref:Polyprenyldihydroxybenzoate methyltransferase n=1 Tax=Ramazzottius varieornatus TaxID=947166 RepID=A0A1D1VFX9_RAMVA|nr:hypothetical protein RvY_11363 [Ramazzottius varieornatus]
MIKQTLRIAMAVPMVPLMLSMFSRWIIWMTIPLRIVWELYQCLYPPSEIVEETKQQNGKNGHHVAANEKDHSVAKEQAQFWKETAEQDQWWSPNGIMTALKRFNTVRLRLIAESYLKHTLGLEATWEDSFRLDALPLSGARICDVGSGGGILTEALAKSGATVVGIDIMAPAIGAAKRHWNETHDQQEGVIAPEYVCQSLASYVEEASGRFDVVVCSEVLEHVNNPRAFAALCCKLVRPGGCVVFTTVNRTIYSLLFCMILFEDVLGILPRWVHRLYLCVKPEEIREVTDKMNFKTVKTEGNLWMPLSLNILNNTAKMNYVPHWFTGLGYSVIAKRGES